MKTILPFGPGLGHESFPGRGKGRIFRIFEQLERMEAAGETDLRASFKEFAARPRQMGLTVVISDFLGEPNWERALRALSTRHDVILFDHSSGLNWGVLQFAAASHQPVIVTTCDPECG